MVDFFSFPVIRIHPSQCCLSELSFNLLSNSGCLGLSGLNLTDCGGGGGGGLVGFGGLVRGAGAGIGLSLSSIGSDGAGVV